MFHLRRETARTLRTLRGVRGASSSASSSGPRSAQRVIPLALGAVALAGGAYFLGRRSLVLDAAPPAKAGANPAFDADPRLRPRFGSPEDYAAAVRELQALFDEDSITTDPDDLAHHGGSAWTYGSALPPSAVVYPSSTEDVVKIMKVASKWRVPVVPYGSGTGLEGQFSAVSGRAMLLALLLLQC